MISMPCKSSLQPGIRPYGQWPGRGKRTGSRTRGSMFLILREGRFVNQNGKASGGFGKSSREDGRSRTEFRKFESNLKSVFDMYHSYRPYFASKNALLRPESGPFMPYLCTITISLLGLTSKRKPLQQAGQWWQLPVSAPLRLPIDFRGNHLLLFPATAVPNQPSDMASISEHIIFHWADRACLSMNSFHNFSAS